MRPRPWLDSFLLVAALAGLAFGLGWKTFTGDPADTSTLIGLAFGVVVGLVAAPKMVETTMAKSYADRAEFLQSLETQLAGLDIYPATQLENFRVYKSEAAGSFSLGPVSASGIIQRVRVQLDTGTAVLVGPSSVLDQLRL